MGIGSGLVFRDACVISSVIMRHRSDAKYCASLSDIEYSRPGPRFDRLAIEQPAQLQRMVALDNRAGGGYDLSGVHRDVAEREGLDHGRN